ncbi:MAG: hypothetical protein IPM95_13485 [Sphingobacteriales bacterium]|nr:hypothetical protein [Sphingobacteriales bacterium]
MDKNDDLYFQIQEYKKGKSLDDRINYEIGDKIYLFLEDDVKKFIELKYPRIISIKQQLKRRADSVYQKIKSNIKMIAATITIAYYIHKFILLFIHPF